MRYRLPFITAAAGCVAVLAACGGSNSNSTIQVNGATYPNTAACRDLGQLTPTVGGLSGGKTQYDKGSGASSCTITKPGRGTLSITVPEPAVACPTVGDHFRTAIKNGSVCGSVYAGGPASGMVIVEQGNGSAEIEYQPVSTATQVTVPLLKSLGARAAATL